MAKSKNPIKKTLPTVTISAKKIVKPAKIDSISVGGQKRHVKDISSAVSKLNKSNTAKSYVKGVSTTNPVNSSKTLSARSATSDVVNRMIDSTKKNK